MKYEDVKNVLIFFSVDDNFDVDANVIFMRKEFDNRSLFRNLF